MTSFSTLFSNLNDKPQASKPSPAAPTLTEQIAKPNGSADRFKLTANNAAAGVKRPSEEPAGVARPKLVKTEHSSLPNRAPASASSRFQLSVKPSGPAKPSSAPLRTTTALVPSGSAHKAVPKPSQRPMGSGTLTPPNTADGSAKPKPKGFAAMLEKAKAAEAAAKTTNVGSIKHKAVERVSRRERERMREEALAQQKAAKKGALGQVDRSRSGTPLGAAKPGLQKKVPEISYKGTMKKPAEPLNYRGTMRAAGSGPKPVPKKGQASDDYGGYAPWDELSDVEDDEEEPEDYDSDDDMEGGFNDLEAEETAALRVARQEDQEALREEERLKMEKLERKRRLQALSKSAAAKKKY